MNGLQEGAKNKDTCLGVAPLGTGPLEDEEVEGAELLPAEGEGEGAVVPRMVHVGPQPVE